MASESEEYVVERIDRKKDVDGIPFYFIKWKGWAEEYNTWEPIDNLNGCPKLLKEFEKRHANSSAGQPQGEETVMEEDEPEDVNAAMAETVEHMKSYGILSKWPSNKEPLSVVGAIHVDGRLVYVVKRKTKQRTTGPGLTRANANLIYAEDFRLKYPHLLIQFYESRTSFPENSKSEEDVAVGAAQNTLLHQSLGSRRAKIIANDMDGKIREMYAGKMAKRVEQQGSNGIEDQPGEDDEAMEEEEVQENDEKMNEEDQFGLPNNVDYDSSDNDDSASGSETELEEINIDSKHNGLNWIRGTTTNQDSSDDEDGWNNFKRPGKTCYRNAVGGICD